MFWRLIDPIFSTTKPNSLHGKEKIGAPDANLFQLIMNA